MLSLNTNIASMTAQNNLSMSQSNLATSIQRLSSGLRINSAMDDAAGMAISSRMSSQIAGMSQSIRNANDGISLAQTAEGALQAVTDNLQRIRDLAVQSANASNTAADRAALNAEVQQRLAEIDRVSSQTSFNGQKVLDGSLGTAQFQVGANVGDSISVNLATSTRLASTGAIATASTANLVTASTPATAGQITINPSTFNFGVAAAAQVDGINALTGATQAAAYDYSAASAVKGNNIQTTNGTLDFSTATGTLAQMNIDGIAVTLNQNYASMAAMATDIQSQLVANTAGYTVTASGNNLTITGPGAAAVAITNADVAAQAAGFANTAGNAGGANQNAIFSVDGVAVTVNTAVTVTGTGTGAGTLNAAITAALTAAGLTGYTVSAGTTGLKITHTGSTAAVAITGANASAVNNGIVNGAGTAGTAAVSSTNAGFTVDGHAITLNTSYTSFADLATGNANSIQAQLNTASPNTYTVTNTNGAITIARNTTGIASTAVNITAISGFASNAGITVANGTAGQDAIVGGIAAGPFTLATGALTLAAGTSTPVDLAGNYTNLQALVDAINTKVSGVNASTDGSTLTLTGSQAIAVGGTLGTTAAASGGFGLSATIAANSGSLATADVLTTSNANTTMQRVDSALEVVNGLRGTLGAIQNRFTSVVSNLQSGVTNLSAARSRVQDTDFAAETAALTKNQILQQAGTAMLAQANALPNSVLTLLK
ncbi:MAG: hypothetical protein GC139_07335 [Sideroxydans sp.]|nr:hypothetical protein [Sideroxydans sp.]